MCSQSQNGVGSLQRIRAHDESIHPYGNRDPSRVAARVGHGLLRPGVVPEGQGEADVAARVDEADREECSGIQQATEEHSQETLNRSS